ncbi:hypothetical protein NLX83_10830 [Allokutzneria sp. A3M-2-11 16]|uniref:hypothetical protein n=1 Tax=Allokutzneria sp. A3M-2-11 16 TaxID=2962043 RepID=UPI0020B74D47|nr:hypothetical protein [Allokutzneria sp. A3M-2-11 16]MCP3799752.1 hypothetical protein [Allokutzneria sp. A3M-2-11 16]
MATIEHAGTAAVGKWIGVEGGTVTQYVNRYADTDNPCPEPDVKIRQGKGFVYGWAFNREQEWRGWNARRLGQGAAGTSKPGSGRRRQPE